MKRITFFAAIICTGVTAIPNNITMPPDFDVEAGYTIPYTGHRQSPGVEVGVTDDDWQKGTTMGRYVWITPSGNYSFYWTYRFGGSSSNRRAYYDYHHPPSYWLGPTCMDTRRSRQGSLDQLSDGRAVGTAIATTTEANAISCVYIDAAEGAGIFTVVDLPWSGNPSNAPVHPEPCVDDLDNIYVSVSNHGEPYGWWTMSTDEGQTWTPLDSCLGGVVLDQSVWDGHFEAWAQYSDDIAVVNRAGDAYGTINYWETTNHGASWSYDTVWTLTPGDSVLGYVWNGAVYDNYGYLHVVFMGVDTMANGGGATGSGWRSQIRHWNQETGQISIVDNGTGWVNSNPGPGTHHPTNSEPQITIDRATGDLYCTWCHADPQDVAANGLVNMDIWGARSTDNGTTWIEQHNITNSPSPGATPGNCDNDHVNHLAEKTLGDTLVMFYLNDKDAGQAAFPPDPGATLTDSPLLFYLYKWNPHGIQEYDRGAQIDQTLSVTPNPATDRLTITYFLQVSGNYAIKLFDICGRLVKTIDQGEKPSGHYTYIMNFNELVNGTYLVILERENRSISAPLILIH